MIRTNIKLHPSTVNSSGHVVESEEIAGGRYRIEKHYVDGQLLRVLCTYTVSYTMIFDLLFEE